MAPMDGVLGGKPFTMLPAATVARPPLPRTLQKPPYSAPGAHSTRREGSNRARMHVTYMLWHL